MAYIEISDSKIWNTFKEVIQESQDENMMEKLMKFTLSTLKQWDNYSVSPQILKSMRNYCNKLLQEQDM